MKRKAIRPLACTVILMPLVLIVNVLASPVPDTGQTKCYDDTQEITCPNPGEPFYGQDAQYHINPQAYTKLDENGNNLPDDAPWPWAMVRDNVTGLIWEVKTDDGSIHDKDNYYTWYTAQEVFIAALNSAQFGGYNDWRLPTVEELTSIVNRDRSNPSINTTYFPNTVSSFYWSTTTHAGYSGSAWDVYFTNGWVNNSFKSSYNWVRAVRGGQCGSYGNYIDNGDGTVTDNDNGLMWQKGTAPSTYTWEQALAYADTLSLAGYDDWRLPDVNELQSLVDYSRYYPSIDTSFFPSIVWSYYWSSTTCADYPYGAWYVNFSHGDVNSPSKSSDGYVRTVRGGQCGSFDDLDADCRIDCIDNCVSTPNCRDSGTCTKGTIAQPCTSNEQCGAGGFCSMQQEDTDGDYLGDACDYCPHDPENDIDSDSICGDIDICPNNYDSTQQDTSPPQGNGIGDACECESDFGCDGDVDGSDASTFKLYFGRNLLYYPCDHINPCRGDFSCDGDVDGTDAALFKKDFGRSSFNNPCPLCQVGEWCVYP